MPNGEKRTFLEDGDTLVMRGWCERAGAVRIGLGEVSGTVVLTRHRRSPCARRCMVAPFLPTLCKKRTTWPEALHWRGAARNGMRGAVR